MAVTTDFTASVLDLNGQVSLGGPTALVWGPDGRLYVTEVNGDVNVLTVEFGDKNPNDGDPTAQFYVTDAETLADVKNIPNFNDDGASSGQQNRQITGIDVTQQFDVNGDPVTLPDGTPAVVMYVTSSDSRIGAGGGGNDKGLDTNSGIVTKLTQQQDGSWEAVDIVRGLPRSEENHATNGLEVIQEIDPNTGKLLSERMILASGGNANTGAPSNNFAGQQETPLSAAILEVDLTEIAGLPVLTDAVSGRAYVYDVPTLNDPTRDDATEENDPFGGNDGVNSGVLLDNGPIQIYSAGYRNAYDVEVTEDGRVWTYDNGANNGWGGRPAGEDEDGDTNATEPESGTPDGYIATNMFVEDNNEIAGNFNPQNWDALHEITRSDDLVDDSGVVRQLSAGQGGAQTYEWVHPDLGTLTLVYGGHPNPTRAEGARAGLLYSPENGTGDALLMVSNVEKTGGSSDFLEVVAWLKSIGYSDAVINSTVVAVDPGVTYSETFATGFGGSGATGRPTTTGVFSLVEDPDGKVGLPVDIDQIVGTLNPVEGNYLENGYTDGAVDTNKSSINGLAEYTSTILDDASSGTKMSGALFASQFGSGGNYLVIGRDEEGIVETTTTSGNRTVAADKQIINAEGQLLGLSSIGDDLSPHGGDKAFQGTVWAVVYSGSGAGIEILQPGNPDTNALLPVYAGQEASDPTDQDLDGINHVVDPFEFSDTNGYDLGADQQLVIDFVLNPPNPDFAGSVNDTGLLGAVLDGSTPNRDLQVGPDGTTVVEDGLFNNGNNLILGANAPKAQIKEVAEGTALGAANTLRDAMQTGVKLAPDVQRLVIDVDVANWTADQFNGEGRVTGLMLGDGTQTNFIRFAFGDVGAVGGPLGLEVGVEVGDVWTPLATVTDTDFTAALNSGDGVADSLKSVQLQLEIAGIGDAYQILARYKTSEDSDFTEIDMSGATVPAGVLRDVLDGTHTITDGGSTVPSGAGIAIFAEKDGTVAFDGVDFNGIKVSAFGNEIAASTASEVQQSGTTGTDKVIYDGTETDLGALAPDVENFDGSGSAADFELEANANDNQITVGSGANSITTGDGSDLVRGTLDNLDGDTITDFSTDDELLIEGFSQSDLTGPVAYADGSAVLTINGKTITLDGPDFTPENFDPADGDSYFNFEDTQEGLRITTTEPLSLITAVNAGTQDLTYTIDGREVTFQADDGGAGAAFVTTGSQGGGGSKLYNGNNSAAIQGSDFGPGALSELHWTERSSNQQYFGYEVPNLENGLYRVDIYIAEIFHGVVGGNWADGSRVFDISLEGSVVEDNFDAFDESPANPATEIVKTYFVEVTDGAFTLDFDARTAAGGNDQPKLSGFALYKVGGGNATVPDGTAPVITSITLDNPQNVQDGTRDATVVLTDETGFDAADFNGLDGSELTVSGVDLSDVSAPSVALSDGDKTATLTYTLSAQGNSWSNGATGEISVAAGAYQDAAGNGSAAASGGYVINSNLANLDRGSVVRAINLGTTLAQSGDLADDPVSSVDDDNAYGGAIAADSLIEDAFGNPITFEADSDSYHTSPKNNQNANIDGKLGATGSNAAGIDLDGSAYHTYRDSNANTWTSTYSGFANGTYIVELHFAELFFGDANGEGGANQRVGGFTVNGELFDAAYDAFAEGAALNGSDVGSDTPSFIRKAVTVTDGTIQVDVDASGPGQAGYSAIVVYDAVDSSLPPEISVADAAVTEGDDATITFTRTGDLSDEVTVEYTLTADTADAADFGVGSPDPVVFAPGEAQVSVTVPIPDDSDEEGAESFTVTIDSAGITGGGSATIADGSATVTIAASDSDLQAPVGNTIFELDFEGVTGEPLDVGGFDSALGGAGAIVDSDAEIAGGKLVVQTAEGDINDAGGIASKNDFTKTVDLSDAGLSEIFLTSRFDNPFTPAVLAAQGITDGVVPNFVQQGIVFGTGTQSTNEMIKLVWGGVAGGANPTGVQVWSKGNSVNQQATLTEMAGAGTALADVASVELTLAIDKAAGTVAQYVTLFDDLGAVLGGVRPVATPGFATKAPLAMTQEVIDNLASTTEDTHVGVTSSDNSQGDGAFTSFEAAWDFLRLSSPQFTDPGEEVTATITGDATATEGTSALYDITISDDPDTATTVTVDVTAGSVDPASLPQDAELAAGGTQVTLTFQPGGALTQQIAVDVADDTLPELAESFDVSISGIGITAGGSASVATTIAANDGPVDSVNGTAVAGGDFSNDGEAPTDLGTLAEGETTILANQQGDAEPGGRDRDYFTFTVDAGQQLTGIILEGYDAGEVGLPQGFIGLDDGNQIIVDPVTYQDAGTLLGGYIYNSGDVVNEATFNDGNLLAADRLGDGNEDGITFGDGSGFAAPLPAGSYTVWLNQGGQQSNVTLKLVTEAIPTVELSIADAPTIAEIGDTGSDTLAFELTATNDFTGDVELTYTDGTTPATRTVSFVDGAATLTIDVPRDDADTGDTTVGITLTGATNQSSSDILSISGSAGSASGIVTEDDGQATGGGGGKGAVVFAINAGGPEVTTTDGVTYEASDLTEWVFNKAFGNPNGIDYTGDGVDNADDQLYETEYFGGKDADPDLSFIRDGLTPGNYILTLKFAEIFLDDATTDAGKRVFDVAINGVAEVIDDLDLVAVAGPNTAYDVDIPVTIGGDGILNISMNPSNDNAKISALALYEVAGDDPLAVEVSVLDASAAEADGTVDVTFTRNGNSDEAVEITFAVTDGTAAAGTDFEAPATQTVTIPANQTTATATITLIDNDVEESDRDFSVEITGVSSVGASGVTVTDATATVTITDDDAPDPVDIDGDGILNIDDPFAYDADNGDGKVLAEGVSFRQDFNVDTTDAFSTEAGFTGILVNPALDPAGTSLTDPYGVQTNEATTEVSGGVFKTQSSIQDSFQASGDGPNNSIRDNYQSAADVSGVDTFTLEAKANNVFADDFTGGIPNQYASYGITLGAGGVDDFVKLVLGGTGNGTGAQLRVEMGHNGSLVGNASSTNLAAAGIDKPTQATIDSVLFRIEVDMTQTAAGNAPNGTIAGSLTGFVTLLDASGDEIGSITLPTRNIAANGSLAQAVAGNNPLTDGDGGIAYGISITHFGSPANQFTGEWDYLELRGPNAAPTADPIAPAAVDEQAAPVVIDLLADANAADAEGATLTVDPASVTAQDGAGNTVDFGLTGTSLSIDPAQFDALNTGESAVVTVTYTISDGDGGETQNTATLTVEGVDGPFTWFLDTDGDGFGDDATTQTAYDQPTDYVDQGGDTDDTDPTIYPDAPEINDGKDNDQDGAIDEDNLAPVPDAEAFEVDKNEPLTIPVAQLLDGDTDADGDTLTVTGVSNPVGGTVDLTGGVVTFTPDPDFVGEASFDYTVSDGVTDNEGTATATVGVTVANTLPISDPADLPPSTDGVDEVEYTGTAQLTLDNTYENLDLGDNASDDVSVTLGDNDNTVEAGSGAHHVDLGGGSDTVTGTGDEHAGDIYENFGEDDELVVENGAGAQIVDRAAGSAVIGVDTDGDGVADFKVAFAGDMGPGSVVGADDGEGNFVLTVDPNATATGDVTETDPPVTRDLLSELPVGETVEDASITVTDGDGDALAFTYDPGTSTLTFDPATLGDELAEGESTLVTVSYDTTAAGSGAVTARSTSFTVLGVDLPPVLAAPIADQAATEDQAFSFTLPAGTFDDDEGAANLVLAATLDDGSALPAWLSFDPATGTFSGTPLQADAAAGPITVKVTATDDNGSVAEDSFDLTPAVVNDDPIAGADSGETFKNVPLTFTTAELLANDSDEETAPTLTAVRAVDGGFVSLDAGVVTFTPQGGFTGTASFEYDIDDGEGGTATGTVTVNVVDGAPAQEIPIPIVEADLSSYHIQDANPTDYTVAPDGSELTLNSNSWKALALPGGSYTITAQTKLQFTFSSTDIGEIHGIGLEKDNVHLQGTEDQLFFGIAGNQLGGWNRSSGNVGELYEMGDGTVTYEIDLGAYAGQSFSSMVFVNDADQQTGNGTFGNVKFIEPEAVNTPPAATDDLYTVAPGNDLTVTAANLLANDSDAEGDTLSLTAVSNPQNGTVELENGIVTFTPDAGFSGTASFDYTVSDGQGGLAVASATIAVASDELVQGITVEESALDSYHNQDAVPSGYDIASDGSSITITENSWKTLTLADGGYTITENTKLRFAFSSTELGEIHGIGLETDNVHGKTQGTDNQLFFGLAGIQLNGWNRSTQNVDPLYELSDGTRVFEIDLGAYAGQTFTNMVFVNDADAAGRSANGTFADISFVEMADINTNPVAQDDILTVEAGSDSKIPQDLFTGNDVDSDGDPLTVIAVEMVDPAQGTVSLEPETGRVLFTPADGFEGDTSFTYTVSDGRGGADTGTVNVMVVPEGTGEMATPIDFSLGTVSSYASQDALPNGGNTVLEAGNALQLDGNVWKQFGIDSYQITENSVLRFDFKVDEIGEIHGIGLDSDGDYRNGNQPLFQLFGNQTFGAASQEYRTYTTLGETVTYEIDLSDFAGQSFDRLVLINDHDGAPQNASQTFSNVQLVETVGDFGGGEAPFIFGGTIGTVQTLEDALFEINLPILDNDTPVEDLDIVFSGLPGFVQTDGTVISGTPVAADVGSYDVTVTVTDPEFNQVTDTFTLEVENQNDAPVGAADTLTGDTGFLGIAFAQDLPAGFFTDEDPDDTLTYSLSASAPSWLQIDGTTGAISGTPDATGPVTFDIIATDGGGLSDTVSVTLQIDAEPPRESVVIEAEDFTGLGDQSDFQLEVAAAASNNQLIRLDVDGSGSVSTDLDTSGAVPGFYDLEIQYFDETDGTAELTVLIDNNDGEGPQVLATKTFDATGLPGQGSSVQAGNLQVLTVPQVLVAPGAQLILQGVADQEQVRIDKVTLEPVDNAAPILDPTAAVNVDENTAAVATITATDPESQPLDYAITGGADAALFDIDATTGALSFKTAPDFETPVDDGADNVYDVTVTASDGLQGTDQAVAVTVTDVNESPVGTDPGAQQVTQGEAVSLPTLDSLFTDPDMGDTLTFSVDTLPAGVSLGADGITLEGTPTTLGSTTVTVTATDGGLLTATASFDIVVAEPGAFDPADYAPDGDLDGDQILNSDDDDVDGDGALNADDPFAYDAQDGMTILPGQTRLYDFGLDGTIFENGMTGFLQGTTNGGAFDENTGAASVSAGVMIVDPVTGGDTGNTDNPQDDAVVGVKNGTFTAKAVVVNPWFGAAPNPGGFDQVGLAIGLDSADMVKLVFGQTAEVVEFQKQEDNTGTKFGGANASANVPLPANAQLDDFATAEITMVVESTDASTAAITATVNFLADDGSVIATESYGTAPIGGALAAALANPAQGVAVGFTHVDQATAPGFVAQMDSLSISAPDDGTGGAPDEVVFRINAGGVLVPANDGGPNWVEDSIAAPSPFLNVTDNRADEQGYTGDVGVIPATLPTTVLDTARSSDEVFSYELPTTLLGGGEDYEVRLYFAELFPGAQTGTFRDFDATLEGVVPAAFNDIDPGTLFGADVGMISAQVKVTDGTLNIGFEQDVKENPIINAIEVVALGDGVVGPPPPADPTDALAILQNAQGVDSNGSYGAGAVGSAELRIMAGNNGIQSSNFGAGSFELENTGDKQIAAVLVDFRNALYRDSVVDFDGSAGDTSAKGFGPEGGSNETGAITNASDADTYFLPGEDPLENSTGTGEASSGGWKGVLLRFDGSSGGFENGETIEFSGDMDPNSIAGLLKNGTSGVDTGAINGWDVGGVSGAELIGSAFTVLFDDGTTATGFLGTDGSVAGSVGTAEQDRAVQTATVTVNGAGSNVTGVYGGTEPVIVVSGTPGDTVKVTMSKGLNPVTNTSDGIADLVSARLADSRPEFQASNAADFQSVEVEIGANGTATVPAGSFDYNEPGNNGADFNGSPFTNGFATAPMVIAAAVVDSDDTPLGPVDRVYLQSNGTPVDGETPGGGTGADGYYEIIGGDRFKIQIEDENANGGTNPGGKWSFVDAPDDENNQSGFQGSGYYLFGSDSSTALNAVNGNEVLEYTIFIPDEDVGTFNFRARVSRDGEAEGDQQNDLWLNFKKAGTNENIEDYLVEGNSEPEPTSQGYIKVFGGPNNGNWGNATLWDGDPGNPATEVTVTEGGLYTVQIAGRSQGFHVDYFELYTGGAPGTGASNSAFIEGEPDSGGGGGNPGGDQIISIDASADDWEEFGGGGSGDLEFGLNGTQAQYVGLRFDDIEIPDGATITDAYIEFQAIESNSGAASFTIGIEGSENSVGFTGTNTPGDRALADTFIWNDVEDWTEDQTYRTPDISELIETVVGSDGVSDGALSFVIEGSGARAAHSFDSDGLAPVLHILFDDIA